MSPSIMSRLLLITVLMVALSMIGAQDPDQEKKDNIWKEYKEKYGYDKKLKDNDDEDIIRRGIFEENVKKIDKHNANEKKSYTQGVNQFTIMTDEEFQSTMLVKVTPISDQEETVVESRERSRRSISVPVSIDWRSWGGIGPIRNQGSCGSCWAFSSVASLEFHYWRKSGHLYDLSEQQLVDCVYGSHGGCSGGWMADAFRYVTNHGGIAFESDYPYQARYTGVCSLKPPSPVHNIGYQTLPANEADVQNYVATHGLVSACVDATHFGSYQSGIFYEFGYTGKTCNHAVNIVGYGVENDIQYWIIRNSWSTMWGESGYMKLAAFTGNFLGIASYVSAPYF